MSPHVTAVALLAGALLVLGPASVRLARASWVTQAPKGAIVLWQALGIAAACATTGAGLCLAVAHYGAGFAGGVPRLAEDLTGPHPLADAGLVDTLGLTLAADAVVVLLVVMSAPVVRTARARRRHRRLLDLISRTGPFPGTLVLDDARATAYCLPGVRPRIVLSEGALRVLAPEELTAVVGHERGHASGCHGLVMTPFAFAGELLRWIPYARLAPRAVATLLEMAADDYASRRQDPIDLARALVRLGISGAVPRCALGASRTALPSRVNRLLRSDRTSKPVGVAAVMVAVLVVALPPVVLFVP